MNSYKISNYLSNKLTVFNFLLILMVVLLHSQNISGRVSGFTPNNVFNIYFQTFISRLSSIAVPMFFSISGFLFFKNKLTAKQYKKNLLKRFKSLFIPYVVVSFLGVVFIASLQVPMSTRKYFSGELLLDASFPSILKLIFLTPINYQLWFVRNLIVICLISPILYWVIKNTKFYFVLILLLAYVLSGNLVPYQLLTTIAYFSLGGYFSIHEIKLHKNKIKFKYLCFLMITWSICIFSSIYLQSIDVGYMYVLYFSNNLGVLFVWFLYDYLVDEDFKISKYFKNLTSFSFFIYLFHEPFLSIIIKLFFSLFGKTTLISLITYLLSPTIMIFLLMIVANFMSLKIKPLYNFLTGNR